MRQILCTATLAACLFPNTVIAEDVYNLNQNQTGFSLPGVTLPQGQDEVRASDGTTCRSAVSGSGAYMDVGLIQGAGKNTGETAAYGRIIVPLERKRARIDCTKLYELEVQRLQMELKLLKMGLGHNSTPGAASEEANWAKEGWSNGM